MATTRLKRLTEAVTRPFKKKATPAGEPAPLPPPRDVEPILALARSEQAGFEQAHPVPFDLDQRVTAVCQRAVRISQGRLTVEQVRPLVIAKLKGRP